jgi:hypothetical protein
MRFPAHDLKRTAYCYNWIRCHLVCTKTSILFDRLNTETELSVMAKYGQSKLANLLFALELNKRYGDRIYVNSVHPGGVNTELTRTLAVKFGKLGYSSRILLLFVSTNSLVNFIDFFYSRSRCSHVVVRGDFSGYH